MLASNFHEGNVCFTRAGRLQCASISRLLFLLSGLRPPSGERPRNETRQENNTRKCHAFPTPQTHPHPHRIEYSSIEYTSILSFSRKPERGNARLNTALEQCTRGNWGLEPNSHSQMVVCERENSDY